MHVKAVFPSETFERTFAAQCVTQKKTGFDGLGVACCLSVPKFVGSNLAETVRIFQGEKILSTLSFGREVKPWVPCRRFAVCKRSLN